MTEKYHHSRVVESLQKENEENCRLLGKSAERELALLAEIDKLKAKYQETDVLYWQQVREINRLKFELKCADVDFSYWKEKAESFECEITDLKDKLEEKLNRLLPDDLCPQDDKSWQQSDAFERIEYLVSAYKSNRDELKMVWEWVVELKAKLAKTEWQPINKDTTKTEKILIGCWYEGKWYEDVGTLWGKQGRRTICVGFRKNEWPTHWMPRPEPPTTEETK